MKRAALGLAALTLAAGLRTGARAEHVTPPVVEVRGGAFLPQEVHANRGETVTWLVREGGHTITEDSCAERGGACLFDFPGGNGTLPAGETRQWTAPDTDVTVGYYCIVHGQPTKGRYPRCGMCGRIRVGAGSPTPTPGPTPTPAPGEQRFVPSQRFPTVAEAVRGAPRGTVVNVAPGTYREPSGVVVVDPGITIRGTGASPAEVVIEGEGSGAAGIAVLAEEVAVENLTVRGFRGYGVLWDGARSFRAQRVVSENNQPSGFLARRSRGGVIADAVARGSGEAGFALAEAPDAELLVERVVAEGNGVGVWAQGAGGLVLRRSLLRGNATGVALTTLPGGALQRGAHVWGNRIEANNARVEPAGFAATLDVPRGVGVWVGGGWSDAVEGNTLRDHERWGVVVTAFGAPALGDRVAGNTVSDSGRADLAWDGLGLGVCFEGNATPEGSEPTSEPPGAQTLYACRAPVQVGVPFPLIDLELGLRATRRYWCPALGPEVCRLVE